MNYRNLFVVLTLKDAPEKFPVEGYRKNETSGHNELLITVFGQKLWVDAHAVKLCKQQGRAWCWRDYREGRYIELDEGCEVCPGCGWWRCPYCSACRCNKPD
jgi:hypothetical protein